MRLLLIVSACIDRSHEAQGGDGEIVSRGGLAHELAHRADHHGAERVPRLRAALFEERGKAFVSEEIVGGVLSLGHAVRKNEDLVPRLKLGAADLKFYTGKHA